MPIDAEPRADGNLVAVDEAGAVLDVDELEAAIANGQSSTVWAARRAHRSMTGEVPRWTSHFATCPQGPKWRRGTKSAMAERFVE
jgi:predicted RNA-binding protein associated with RNAse of E/G family